jgi:ABC-type polysaccharide transport system permease subunit
MVKYPNLHRKSLWQRMAARWQIYLLLLIPVAYIITFSYVPMSGLVLAFKDYDFTKGIWGSDWVGLENFTKFFSSYKFGETLSNTLVLSIYSLLAGFPLPIIFALVINAFPGRKYKKIVQTTTYVPYFISTVVMVGIILQILNYRTGIYGTLYTLFTGAAAPDLIADAGVFKHIYVLSGIWQATGYNAIIYIAALANVDQALHEAAEIDGASRFQRIIHIDLPCILPTAVILLILATGGIMNVGFEKVLLLQNNMNLKTSEVISTYVYKVGLARGIGDFSLSTAIGMFNSVINFTLLVTINWVGKKFSGNGIF